MEHFHLSEPNSFFEAPIPSYIPDLDDILATWCQATNDGNGWKLEKKDRPPVGDYLHSHAGKAPISKEQP